LDLTGDTKEHAKKRKKKKVGRIKKAKSHFISLQRPLSPLLLTSAGGYMFNADEQMCSPPNN